MKRGLPFLALFGFALWAYDIPELRRFARFFVFQTRDLDRAVELLHGQAIFFGPETTGGGHLPGPFYYFLLALGWVFSGNWLGPFTLLTALSAAAAVAGWWFVRRHLGQASAWLWFALFVLSAPLQNYLGVFLNVSHQAFFLVAAIIAIATAYLDEQPGVRASAFLATCILIGLSIQLHFSSLSLLFALAFVQGIAPRVGLARLPLRDVAIGVAGFFATLTPYLAWLVARKFGFTFGQEPIFAGDTRNALPAMFSFLDWPNWARAMNALDFFLNAVPLALPVAIAAAGLERFAVKLENPPSAKRSALLTILCICAAAGLVPALYVFIAPIGYRYGMAFTVSAVFVTVVLLDPSRAPVRHYSFALLAALLAAYALGLSVYKNGLRDFIYTLHSSHLMVLALVFAAVFFFCPHERRRSFLAAFTAALLLCWVQNPSLWTGELARHEMSTPAQVEWRKFFDQACERTGWSFERMLDSLYFVNGHMELDPRPPLRFAGKDCAGRPGAAPTGGYFLTFQVYLNDRPFLDWVLEQPIDGDIREGLKSGAITLGEPEQFHTLLAIPYDVTDLRRLPPYFHNIGVGYAESRWQKILRLRSHSSGVARLKAGGYLLSWNDCGGAHEYCLSGAIVDVAREGVVTRLSVNLIGDALSQSSPWIRPDWTLSWRAPYLEAHCGGGVKKFALAGSIGYERVNGFFVDSYSFYLSNHSLLTPFRREIIVDCPVTRITLGREGGTVEMIQSTRELGPASLSIDI